MRSLQVDQVEISELAGAQCEQLLGVPGDADDDPLPCYLCANGRWSRFFLNAGLLFWDDSDGPDREDDLWPNLEYRDLAAEWGIRGRTIESVVMRDGVLTISLAGGARVVWVETPRGTVEKRLLEQADQADPSRDDRTKSGEADPSRDDRTKS